MGELDWKQWRRNVRQSFRPMPAGVLFGSIGYVITVWAIRLIAVMLAVSAVVAVTFVIQ